MTDLLADLPEDFDEFWDTVVNEARLVPLDFRRDAAVGMTSANGHRLDHMQFRGSGSVRLEGWLSYPAGARRMPSFLWIPPYGRESLLPNDYGTRSGMVSLSLNLHGLGAFHQEKYTPDRGYFAKGADSPATWVFRRLIQHALVAMRVLQAQPEVDEDRIAVCGMSQGGGMAIWTGAASPIAKAVCADMPFLGQARQTLSRNGYRYPIKELVDFMETETFGREKVLYTTSYFDTVHLASRCHVPTQVARGLKDPACRPETAQAIYDALPGQKRLVTYDWGHDWHPDMVANNRDWMLENLT